MDKAAFGRETAADQSDVHLDAACWRGSAWGAIDEASRIEIMRLRAY